MSSAKARRSLSSSSSAANPNLLFGNFGLDSTDIDIGLLTEEVLETAYAGHEFIKTYPPKSDVDPNNIPRTHLTPGNQRAADQHNATNPAVVSVILDYDDPTSSLWTFKTEPGGWRRVMLNLVGNSLKYTSEGSITVKLTATPPSKETGKVEVELTVSDTGKGISRDFQRWHMFSPFVQEDPLSPGTGLGLSIVKQIVTGMGGAVSVKSTKDVGTEFRVSISMTPSAAPARRNSSSSSLPLENVRFEGLSLSMLDIGQSAGEPNLATTFSKQCKAWFNIDTELCSDFGGANVYAISATRIDTLLDRLRSMPSDRPHPLAGKVLVVMCRHLLPSAKRKDLGIQIPRTCRVEYVCQPFGPKKMASLLTKCSTHLQDVQVSEQVSAKIMSADGSDVEMPLAVTLSPEISYRDIVDTFPLTSLDSPSGAKRDEPRRVKSEEPVAIISKTIAPAPETGLSVLLVDDNKINVHLLETFMKKHKYRYAIAMNGLEALEAYRAAHHSAASSIGRRSRPAFDYVLMDINMPVMDGLESTREIRAFERGGCFKPAMIVALTGLSSASAQQEAFASGVDLFLTKPVRLKELTKILQQER